MPNNLFTFDATVRKRPNRPSGVVTIPSCIMREFRIRRGDRWRCSVDVGNGELIFRLASANRRSK